MMDEVGARLRAPFQPNEIEWRVQSAGMRNGEPWARVLAYVTSRAVQQRLDDVFGVFGWQNAFREGPSGGTLCGIGVRDPETGEWIWKWDGAENTDMESVKGGLSGAEKRAAVQLGVGRYLYDLPEGWAEIHDKGRYYQPKDKSGKNRWPAFKWDPPELPKWATPEADVDVLKSDVTGLMTRVELNDEQKAWCDAALQSGDAAKLRIAKTKLEELAA